MKKHPFLPLLMLLCLSQSAFGQGVDVRDWLGRPGVRLVAVEFYATWCKPCMEAMPRWKALQDTYADAGLRVIAVSTQDPSAGCASIGGFIPDENVCDLDGRIAQSFGVGNALPSAFLWSWQGNVLVERGHITEIEREVERYLDQNPRVLIQAGPDIAKGLSTAIERELVSSGKMTVVAKAKDRKAFMAIKKRQTSIAFDDSKACELGKEVPANSVLKAVMVGKGTTRYLNLALYDLETGCQLKAASARLFKNKGQTARAAVANLLATLKRKTLQMPRGNLAANVVKEKTLVKEVDDWVPKAKALAVVQFDSEPQGAMVTIGGKTICQATPCQKTVAPGAVKVIFSKANYLKKTVDSVAANQAKIKARLDADFGYLTINTKPKGVPVLVDGTDQGPAPVEKLKLAHGPHRVELDARCHYPVVKEMNIERGKDRVLTLDARVRPAGVSVFVSDKKGNDLQGTVFVDGRRVGEAYETLKVPLCSQRLQLDAGDKKYSVKLVGQLLERQVTTLKLSVDGTRAKATWTKPNASKPVASTASETDWASGQSRLRVVNFNSTPPGAAVFVGDRHLCTTPCQRALVLGNHVVKMALERYLPKQERVDITKDGAFTWPLTPNFAPVMIKSKPRGVAIYVDGKKAGKTPYVKDLEAGVHTVAVKDPCYLAYSAQVVVKPGEPKAVDLPITPVPAGLEVRATDGKDDVVAEVFLDGTKLGVTPGTFKVPVCGQTLVVKHAKKGVFTKTLSLKAKQTTPVVATVSPQVAAEPPVSGPGGLLASSCDDGTVGLWRVSKALALTAANSGATPPAEGKIFRSIKVSNGQVTAVAFSPDGKLFATNFEYDGIRLWRTSNGKLLRTLESKKAAVSQLAFSLDGKTIVSGSWRGKIYLWRVRDGKVLRMFRGHTGPVRTVAVSPDGKTIASGSDDFTVRLWRLRDGKELRVLRGHENIVNSVAFSPDGKTIASASADTTIRLWRVRNGRYLYPLRGHPHSVNSVAFSPHDQTIVTGGVGGSIRLWHSKKRKQNEMILGLETGRISVSSVAFSPDGKVIASASGRKLNQIQLWNAKDGTLLETLRNHNDQVRTIAFQPSLSGSRNQISSSVVPSKLSSKDIGYGFVRIQKGSFKMGSPVSEPGRFIDETEHRVTLTRNFMMGRHEVTNEQYQRIMGGTGAFDCPNCPYDGASWLDAVAFANRLSENEGLEPCYTDKGDVRGGENQLFSCTGYRLPTEAEWEYAARGGTTKARYGQLNDVAWSGANAGFKAHPVGKKAPNASGLYDMLGNAWEWCHDHYGAYGSAALTDPTGPGFGVLRVKRGGSWFDLPAFVRAAKRLGMPKGSSLGVSGFRLVRSLR